MTATEREKIMGKFVKIAMRNSRQAQTKFYSKIQITLNFGTKENISPIDVIYCW